MMRFGWRAAFPMMAALAPPLAAEGVLPARFTLGEYIPANVWMYSHFVHNPERAWLD